MNTRSPRRLIVFTRYPEVGKTKTRLIPALGAEGATRLHRRLALRTLRTARALAADGVEIEVRHSSGTEAHMRHWLGEGLRYRPQAEGDLGARLRDAVASAFAEGCAAVAVIGTDCPGLTPAILRDAFAALDRADASIVPAEDGGYCLLALRRPEPALFTGMDWGTEKVFAQTRAAADRVGLKLADLPPLGDLDVPEDLAHWEKLTGAEDAPLDRVSVIIPTLNEGMSLADALSRVLAGNPHEVIIADGGSTDDTRQVAARFGAKVVNATGGRASQMNTAAAVASGASLLFLHADTLPPAHYPEIIGECLARPAVAAGAFRFDIAGPNFPGRRTVVAATRLRPTLGGVPYGDQGLFVSRRLFEETGGFAPLPIMEDYEWAHRIHREGRIVITDTVAVTSGRRWRHLGACRTTVINAVMVLAYRLGVSPVRLAGFYRHRR